MLPNDLLKVALEFCDVTQKEMHNVYKGLKLRNWRGRTIRVNGEATYAWVNEG